MSDDVLICCENVSKKFCRDLKRSMFYGAKDAVRRVFGMGIKTNKLRKSEFWALDNVSFELKRGDCLGVIGSNGAGKSTLLKLLNGIILPDKGRITTRGRTGALIQVGAGFHPNLTGRENIYVNGQILGMDKGYIDKKFDEIVAFADIGDFLDTPVKFYSSGMFVRLGFAVAAHMEPDILLIDEILAVGDMGFRAKCYNAVYDLQKNAAIIIVSHNMYQISRTSSKAMLLKKGKVCLYSSNVNEVVEEYNVSFDSGDSLLLCECGVKASGFQINGSPVQPLHEVEYRKPFSLSFDFQAPSDFTHLEVSVSFISPEQQVISNCDSVANGFRLPNIGKKMRVHVTIPEILLGLRGVEIGVMVRELATSKILFWQKPVTNLRVLAEHKLTISPAAYHGFWSLEN